ncbi:MAG TPA: hypothetical protein VNI61_01275 [Gemmatimonadales bacterium]|nr:hypothetical protein [Gemmatimonadales bacterium]
MPRIQRRKRELLTYAQALGWRLTAEEYLTLSLAVPGRETESILTVVLREDSQGTPDRIELWNGPARLDALLLAITDVRDPSRRWLPFLLEGVALQHGGPAPAEMRAVLDAALARGVPPEALNDCALRLGAGGVDGVILRFARTAIDIEGVLRSSRRRPQVLAADEQVARVLLSGDALARLGALLERATGGVAPALRVWVGVPCSRIWLETPVASGDTLRLVVEFNLDLAGVGARGVKPVSP